MNEVSINKVENKVYISLYGKIDSVFAMNHQDEIFSSVNQDIDLTLDFSHVEYISSAGLRIVLKCAKLAKSMIVIEVNEAVYEVFSMSGFTEIINLKRAKRELSIEGKELIGEGANGKVYRYDIDTIIKVYKDSSHIEYIENEISMSKKAFILGVPTAIPFDIVKIKEGGYGAVYELLKSDVLSSLIAKYPEKTVYFIKLFAEALSKFLHSETFDETLPKKIEYPNSWVSFLDENHIFSDEVIAKIKALLRTVENGHTLVHGDFHIKNVMLQKEEPIIIDMDTLGIGHPIFELTYTFYSMVEFDKIRPEKSFKFFGINYDVVSKIYYDTFDMIFKDKSKEEKKDIQNKITFLANLRIAYRTHHHLPLDLEKGEVAVKYINENIDKLETLDFVL